MVINIATTDASKHGIGRTRGRVLVLANVRRTSEKVDGRGSDNDNGATITEPRKSKSVPIRSGCRSA